ncbi:glycosyltransferase family 2 protein [Paenibacillus sp. NPDC058071]|uniref:glycosyltransferase family 2 protein n=1 Tax=Paenibacillus sp. NPDC058071 TaxID=3346326 RepID=UPI0036DC39D9
MRASVVIPSYKRVANLADCLAGLCRQTRMPDEVIVVVRDTDKDTRAFLSEPSQWSVKAVAVEVPGAVAALNAGIAQATGDIVTILDDDTIPFPDWLEKMVYRYEFDPALGGLGGKDWVYHGNRLEEGANGTVGKMMWFGRMIGNHHIGTGGSREVDILKGANMSFRKAAIAGLRFDERLRGSGAQVHLEVGISLSVKRLGWRVVYDPDIGVSHYPAERFDEDKRNGYNEAAWCNEAHNETYVLLKHLNGYRRPFFILWALLIGSKPTPGIANFARMLPRERTAAFHKLASTYRGRWDGWKSWRASLDS